MVSMLQSAHASAESLSDTVLAQLLLSRLERAVSRLGDRQVMAVPAWHNLARLAAVESYQDCVALGLENEARMLVDGLDLGLAV